MKARYLLNPFLAAILMSGTAQAEPLFRAPGLLPTEIARPLLEHDPSVSAARAGLDRANAEARGLEVSPYEWTAQGYGQQRDVQNDRNYSEWSAGIERTIRLPAKAAADRAIGKTGIAASEAAYGEALHEAARDLAALWVDWLAAERARELAAISLRSFEESLGAVEKRARAGDAARLDLGTARAELVEQRRQENDAKTAATVAWTRLSGRFPGIGQQAVPMPMPLPIDADTSAWRERILSQSDELKVAEFRAKSADSLAARARADRIPDPTIGAYTTSETSGQQKIIGVSVSVPIPLPGGIRSQRSRSAAAGAEVARYEAEAKRREFESGIASEFAAARGAFQSMQIAAEGTTAMQENAGFIQRAYSLGEAGLLDLLVARRQAATAANNAVQAQATALKAYYGLVIDAHWTWDLEHE
ncbi:TolC family protein [uncultured Nevskia sp.]|uniref:TolC family protein n=1 Tax=uncultured Nevskia sp. TaxID=228950 RepID=UPI0025F60D5F|nr:TolC family protein [uncultured Nevskia sp.]